MAKMSSSATAAIETLQKAQTGIQGLDEILKGGLPQGRISLVCGGPGCGKTLLATEFLVRGATQYGEPGVFMAFEENPDDLTKNVASLGIDLQRLVDENKIFVDFVYIERSEIEETGEYDLEGLFIRLGSAIEAVGAKRVVLDTIETIFAGFSNESILRSEIRRLFRWLKDRGITAIVTGERGEKSLTRYGLEEYISDCVILLDNRIDNKMTNRLLRVVKYRGSSHGTDEYPFLIGEDGIWVQPITSLGLDYAVPKETIPTGVSQLDEMFDRGGYYRGSSILISGMAGTGKTSLAASLVNAACRRGERCLFIAFEESTSQILRNMGSIGIDLAHWVEQGLLHFHASRPSSRSLEMHLLILERILDEVQPGVVVIDPINNLVAIGSDAEIRSMLVRLIDHLKMKQITALFTSLTAGGEAEVSTQVGISSLMDTWLLLRNLEINGERTRGLYVLKSRGQAHSTQIREFYLTDQGIQLVDVYVGPQGILTGSARVAQVVRERMAHRHRQQEIDRRQRDIARKRKSVEAQVADLLANLEAEEDQLQQEIALQENVERARIDERETVARFRQSEVKPRATKDGPQSSREEG